jgi:hypothetical protein
MDRAPNRIVWADGVLTLLSLCFQVGLSLLDIQQKFWAALFVWLVFVPVGAHLLWRVLATKLRLILIGLFVPATACFVYPGLKRQGDKEHVPEMLRALLHSIDERYLWMAGGASIAFAAIGIGWVVRRAIKRRIAAMPDAPHGKEDQQGVTPPATDAEIPDDQVIPAYLDRLPGDQWELLLGLNLGEQVLDLDAPGLGSLMQNRLAQKLRPVEPNKYLFRLHPDNAKFVHARFARPITGIDRESFQQIKMMFPSCSEAIEYALAYTATEYLVPARGDPTKQVIVALLEGFPVLECKRVKRVTDSDLSLPAPPEHLIDNINDALDKYGILVGYLERTGRAFLEERRFYRSAGYRQLRELHHRCLETLSVLNRRTELHNRFNVAALSQLLRPQPVSPANGTSNETDEVLSPLHAERGSAASPKRAPWPILTVHQSTDNDAAVLMVENTGDPVEMECKIAAIHGVEKWPSQTVFTRWENSNERKVMIERGDVKRIVIARFRHAMTPQGLVGSWTIYGEGLELESDTFRCGPLLDEQHDLLEPLELRVTIVSDQPRLAIPRTFRFHGKIVDFPD